MDSEDIATAVITGFAALGGVTLSWLLQQLAEWSKARQLEKAELGVLVAELFRLHRDIVSYALQMAAGKSEEGDHKGEAELEYLIQRLYMDSTKLIDSINESRRRIARSKPIAATRLDDVQGALRLMTKREVESKEEWSANHRAALSGLAYTQRDLQALVLMVAWMHSPCTWLLVKWEWHRRPPEAGDLVWSPKRRKPPP